MSEPTIQELIQELIGAAVRFGHTGLLMKKTKSDSIKDAGDALLSSITQLQQEADEWKKSYDRALKDSDELYAAKTALLERAENAEKEADEWHKMADKLAESLEHIVDISDIGTPSTIRLIYKYRYLAECYPHAHPSEDTSVEGTIINHPTKCAHCGKIVDSIDMFIHYSPTEWWCRKCTVEGTEVK